MLNQDLFYQTDIKDKLGHDYPLMFFLEQRWFGRILEQQQLWAAEHVSCKVTF